jgi:hypothetical protein
VTKLADVLTNPQAQDARAWLYLPANTAWSLDSPAAVLESEEVPPELEDEPDAGVPKFAKDNGLAQILPITAVQDVVSNAHQQRSGLSLSELLHALKFYYEHDAFIEFVPK